MFDLIVHGNAVFVASGEDVQAMQMRHAWPFADGSGWAFVVPVVTGRRNDHTRDGGFDAVDVWVAADGQFGGYRAELDADSEARTYGTIGKVITTHESVPALWATCSRPPVESLWGKPHTDDLIPICLLYTSPSPRDS